MVCKSYAYNKGSQIVLLLVIILFVSCFLDTSHAFENVKRRFNLAYDKYYNKNGNTC